MNPRLNRDIKTITKVSVDVEKGYEKVYDSADILLSDGMLGFWRWNIWKMGQVKNEFDWADEWISKYQKYTVWENRTQEDYCVIMR